MKLKLILLAFCFTFSVQAQVTDSVTLSPDMEKQADALFEHYAESLALNGEQIPLFRKTLERYLVAADQVKASMEGEAELKALTQLQLKETGMMGDILTQEQLRLYKGLRQKYQPLKVVGED